ncbi:MULTISPECIES: NAD(P)H nitroreductase [unclassified Motilimonas]|uniref:NAD(P)H nitroreductase n=1 Tax=unclassified Motilimonas TaxID=2643697 RepID=UPI001E55A4A3|nr:MULTISPECIES: NAD(P)H nitroreductase [unclassified Motilimonas]MCE0556136.1 NAD(P)H nitroreductase [Motilimonas sp. E26]MDO6527972.1 NAD(P)H nitroreductase [Motilimonas sp. 1_MG-2023]
MLAMDLLLKRRSCPRLAAPAPDSCELETILQAGLRAPDHGSLQPWRFIVAQGDGLLRLGDIYYQAMQAQGADEAALQKAQNMPQRAPVVISIIAKVTKEHKVPEIEQIISAGCCVHAMQMAAQAMGYGGVWRTGDLCYNAMVEQGLGLAENESLVGFLYIGTPVTEPSAPKTLLVDDFVSHL